MGAENHVVLAKHVHRVVAADEAFEISCVGMGVQKIRELLFSQRDMAQIELCNKGGAVFG